MAEQHMTGELDDSQRFQVEEARDVLFNWDLTAPHSDREMVLAGQVRNLLAIIDQAFSAGPGPDAADGQDCGCGLGAARCRALEDGDFG